MLPSIKTLRQVFGEDAKYARAILEMDRDALETLPECIRRRAECYGSPSTRDLRMTALDALAGTFGIEAFDTRIGPCYYLNAGDPYVPTLIRFRGRYRVACWGDIAERHTGE